MELLVVLEVPIASVGGVCLHTKNKIGICKGENPMKFTGIGTHVFCSFEWLTVMSFVQRNNFRVLGH